MTFYRLVRTLIMILFNIIYKIEMHGKDNIPKDGKLIICSNHINFLDPPLLAVITSRQICFMAKKELFKNKFIGYIIKKLGTFPVNREGNDLSAIKNSLKVLNKGQVLGIFPEGTRVAKMNLENVKAGVGMLSIKSKAPVIPVYIEGSYKPFTKIKIHIGQALYLNEYHNKKLNSDEYLNISKFIMKSIYNLKRNI